MRAEARASAAEALALREEAAAPVLARLRRDLAGAPARLKPIVEYVGEHLFDPGFTYERLRRELEIRDNGRATRFRAVFGATPADYARDHRMEVALALLGGSRLAVGTIAALVGSTPEVFSGSFTRWAGVGPRAYRRLCRSEAAGRPREPPPPELQPAGWRRLREGTLADEEAIRLVAFVLARYPAARQRLFDQVAAEVARTTEVVERVERLLDELRLTLPAPLPHGGPPERPPPRDFAALTGGRAQGAHRDEKHFNDAAAVPA